MIRVGFKSNRGKKRKNNEDSCFVLPKEQVYIVADGVGGNRGGEKASEIAVSTIAEAIKDVELIGKSEEEIYDIIDDCINLANRKILAYANSHTENEGMATTIVICHINKDKAYFANVGDSRAYLIRTGEIFQLTEDHSFVNNLLKKGLITETEATTHEKKNMITKALGAEEHIEADYYQLEFKDEDIILLCTDGLYNEVPKDEIKLATDEVKDMDNLAEILIKMANYHGGRDNVTAVCLRIEGGNFDE